MQNNFKFHKNYEISWAVVAHNFNLSKEADWVPGQPGLQEFHDNQGYRETLPSKNKINKV